MREMRSCLSDGRHLAVMLFLQDAWAYFEEGLGETAGYAKVGKITIDEETELAKRFGVVSTQIPVLIRNGIVSTMAVGFRQKEAVISMIQ